MTAAPIQPEGSAPLTGRFDAAQDGERMDRALAAQLASAHPTLTRSRLKSLIEARAVRIDGVTVLEPSRRVKQGQDFELDLPPPDSGTLAPQPMDLDILHEDEDVVVVDKPPGLVVHPAAGNPDHTLVNALLAHCGEGLRAVGGAGRPGIVHRLDKDTSGLMVVAKTELALLSLGRQFAAHSVERQYQAVVWGMPATAEGEIDAAIGRSRTDRKKMSVRSTGGKAALTRYRVLRALAGGAIAHLACRLATGRTHQIRVHLASIGHPLVGDPVYGRSTGRRRALPPASEAAASGFPRQALDAVLLGFEHPRTGSRLRFERPLRSDIMALLRALESGQAGL
jgi:23S rRNA pseudouridine1911/1915/1917 synthase